MPRGVTWILWTLVAAACAVGGAWVARQHDSSAVALASGTWLPQARQVEPFALTDHTGAPFTQAQLRGRPSLVFFGFTNCPHICPTTLNKLVQVKRDSGIPDLRVILVSVDPERDTPAALAKYLGHFDPEFVGLTGDKRVIEGLAKNFAVAMARTDQPGGTYTMDHTSAVFLVDARGKLVALFTPPIESPNLAADLRGVASRLTG
jgi:protein SCO1